LRDGARGRLCPAQPGFAGAARGAVPFDARAETRRRGDDTEQTEKRERPDLHHARLITMA
jgi:hypothetical protein